MDNPKLPPPVLKGNDHIKEYVGAAVAYFLRRQDWSPDAMALPLVRPSFLGVRLGLLPMWLQWDEWLKCWLATRGVQCYGCW